MGNVPSGTDPLAPSSQSKDSKRLYHYLPDDVLHRLHRWHVGMSRGDKKKTSKRSNDEDEDERILTRKNVWEIDSLKRGDPGQYTERRTRANITLAGGNSTSEGW